jgi:hypothetical protein
MSRWLIPILLMVGAATAQPAHAVSHERTRNPVCAKLTFMGIGGEGLTCPDQMGACPARYQRYGNDCHDPTLVKVCPDGAPRARNDSCE